MNSNKPFIYSEVILSTNAQESNLYYPITMEINIKKIKSEILLKINLIKSIAEYILDEVIYSPQSIDFSVMFESLVRIWNKVLDNVLFL